MLKIRISYDLDDAVDVLELIQFIRENTTISCVRHSTNGKYKKVYIDAINSQNNQHLN